ncbi:MAG: terpene cyclase/mutase family protein [Planctomycetes bacterium]|nr:terpene cyclase/mutase family protein [Planctomycetota bacterium]
MASIDPTGIKIPHPASHALHDHESFADVMAEQLRHAPYLAIAILIHAVALLILWQIKIDRRIEPTPLAMNAQLPEQLPDVPPEEIEEKKEIEPVIQDNVVPEETPVLEPTVPNADFDDQQEPQADSAFDESALNDVIGIGGDAGSKYGGRGPGGNGLGHGSTTHKNVIDGLDWLSRHQDADGHWDADEFMKHDPAEDRCDGVGSAVHDVGLTGLATLAFLAEGSTLRSGTFKNQIKRAVVWIKDQQAESGAIGPDSHRAHVYNHAIATLALVEAYGLSKYKTLERYAQRAVDYICSSRNPYSVWRYYPRDGSNDSSVTGWMVFVLQSARDFGLRIDPDALAYSKAWFDEVTDPSTGQCGYTKRGEGSSRELGMAEKFPSSKTEALTAVGLLSRIFLGQSPNDAVLASAADTLVKKPPVWNENDGSIDLYYWYYGSYALFQVGGRRWSTWKKSLEPALVKSQRREGAARGSWDPVGAWGHDGGRVYSTALAVLTLQVYYRYSRIVH